MKPMTTGVAVLAGILMAGGAVAQPAPRPGAGEPGQHPGRDEAFKMVDAYIVSNLQESLGLTDAQFTALLPLVKKMQTDRREFSQRRLRALNQLGTALAGGKATEGQVTELLKEIKAVEADEPAALKRDRDAVDAALSPVQQAKFRVLQLEVERKIRALMLRARAQQRKGGRPGAPPEPADDLPE